MNKRYQVFLSSTFVDLEEERKEVMSALQKAGFFVAGMELFPSDDDDSWEVIKRVIDQSDYYVLVVAGRYGSIGKSGKSFTEMEYDYAKEKGLPVLAFLHSDPQTLQQKFSEVANPEKLRKFKERIEKSHNRKNWRSKHELSTEILASLSQTTNLRPSVGWVRGNVADDNQVLLKNLDLLRAKYETLETERDELVKKVKALQVHEAKEHFAWGADEVELTIKVKVKDSSEKLQEVAFPIQWSRVFDLISPELIGWRSSHEATSELCTDLARVNLHQASTQTTFETYGLSQTSLAKIRDQFLAMKLIKVDTRKIVSNDHWAIAPEEYEVWRLSDLGLQEHASRNAQRRHSL